MLTVLIGDAIEQLRMLPDESAQCCVTSPPYWGLRDYGTAAWEGGEESHKHDTIAARDGRGGSGGPGKQTEGAFPSELPAALCSCGAKRIDSQLGLEKRPEEYVAKMVEVFREVRRVLRQDGTLWLNLGDSYAGSWGNYGGQNRGNGSQREIVNGSKVHQPSYDGLEQWRPPTTDVSGLKPKDLCGIPWRVAFALQADGWWLRSDIIWNKPNPMPESVTDRPTKSHEYLFLLTNTASYYFDQEAIREAPTGRTDPMRFGRCPDRHDNARVMEKHGDIGRNKRSVWTVATAPYPEAHFATYPPDLIKPCIMAGTSAKGCCSKCGAPWERIVERDSNYGDSTDEYQGKQLQGDEQHSSRRMILNMKRMRDQGRDHDNPFPTKQTLGWQPTCKCDVGVQPCVVLDPFAGSGTSGAVALELGRKAVLIELNPKYVELIEQRCNVTMGLALI